MKNGETKDIDGIRVEGISEFGFRDQLESTWFSKSAIRIPQSLIFYPPAPSALK